MKDCLRAHPGDDTGGAVVVAAVTDGIDVGRDEDLPAPVLARQRDEKIAGGVVLHFHTEGFSLLDHQVVGHAFAFAIGLARDSGRVRALALQRLEKPAGQHLPDLQVVGAPSCHVDSRQYSAKSDPYPSIRSRSPIVRMAFQKVA